MGNKHKYQADGDRSNKDLIEEVEKLRLEISKLKKEKTIRKQVEKKLHESETIYKLISENTRDLISVTAFNLKTTFIYVSPSHYKLLGYTQEELVGTSAMNFIHPEDKKKLLPLLNQYLANKIKKIFTRKDYIVHEEFECRIPQKSGGWRNVEIIATMVEDKFVFVGRDITEQIKTREDKIKLEEQLRQAQKMEAVGALAGGIAHDFNNLLGMIMGYTELSMTDTKDMKVIKENLKYVMIASERAKEMVQQILTFSRKSGKERTPLHIDETIKEAISFLRSTIPATIDIIHNINDDLGLISGNSTQINQVLLNLCTNAAYAMKDKGGLLEINLREVALDKESSNILDLDPGMYQQLSVSDTGCGMSKKIQERIFEPYYTTKSENEGTGMGLAVIYGIVKSHEGAIEVYSEPEKGTVFNVYFPVLKKKKEKLQNEQSNIYPGCNEKILLVDDEEILVEIGTKMLKKIGYKAEGKISSIEALEVFKADPDNYDLIITDMTMPNMTGIQLTEEIHKIRPDIPVILSTGFSDSIVEKKLKSQGISALIMKPVVVKVLAETIRKVLKKDI